jgi:hypothetical protein
MNPVFKTGTHVLDGSTDPVCKMCGTARLKTAAACLHRPSIQLFSPKGKSVFSTESASAANARSQEQRCRSSGLRIFQRPVACRNSQQLRGTTLFLHPFRDVPEAVFEEMMGRRTRRGLWDKARPRKVWVKFPEDFSCRFHQSRVREWVVPAWLKKSLP